VTGASSPLRCRTAVAHGREAQCGWEVGDLVFVGPNHHGEGRRPATNQRRGRACLVHHGIVSSLPPEIRAYYERGQEAERLSGGFPSGPLELARTQELILRYLPTERQSILDVGGGPGVYATWLAELGHDVRLVDPVSLHVEQARAAGVDATEGDARDLDRESESVDVVLLLGPLYHMVDRADRLRALGEARRVLRAGGLVFVAAISRFAALFDLLVRLNRLHEDDVFAAVADAVVTGVFHGSEGGLFTTAYFHRPSELREEVGEAGFNALGLFNVEGPGFVVHDFTERWSDPATRDALLAAARLVEEEPEMLAAASHLLLVGRR
jgi:SAM-dependent methyltransferase